MKQLTFLELSKRVLEEEKRPLSAEEIWEIAQTKGYDKGVKEIQKALYDGVLAKRS